MNHLQWPPSPIATPVKWLYFFPYCNKHYQTFVWGCLLRRLCWANLAVYLRSNLQYALYPPYQYVLGQHCTLCIWPTLKCILDQLLILLFTSRLCNVRWLLITQIFPVLHYILSINTDSLICQKLCRTLGGKQDTVLRIYMRNQKFSAYMFTISSLWFVMYCAWNEILEE